MIPERSTFLLSGQNPGHMSDVQSEATSLAAWHEQTEVCSTSCTHLSLCLDSFNRSNSLAHERWFPNETPKQYSI